jgi:opacity protein-like surface antigen
MNRFTILLVFISSITFGQENTKRLTPGIQVASVFSDNSDHGISPAFTINYGRWMFLAGPRFAYDRMFEKKHAFYTFDRQLIIDASFRCYILSEEKRVRPFVQLGASYKHTHYAYNQEYRVEEMYVYGPVFDHNFTAKWEDRSNSVNIFAGAGVDVRIWKGLSVFAGAAIGTTMTKSQLVITNTGNGVVEYSERAQQNGRIGWIASTGMAYCF